MPAPDMKIEEIGHRTLRYPIYDVAPGTAGYQPQPHSLDKFFCS